MYKYWQFSSFLLILYLMKVNSSEFMSSPKQAEWGLLLSDVQLTEALVFIKCVRWIMFSNEPEYIKG